MEQGNKKLIKQALLFIIVFAVAFLGTKYLMSGFNSTNSKLKKVAIELNKKGPQLIDSETRLDSSTVEGSTLQYHYTLVHIVKEDSSVNTEEAKKYIMKQSQTNYDANPQMKDFREWQVALEYDYYDKNGKPLFNFTITSKNK